MDYENILYAVQDRIATITLNRPEKRNALSFGLRRDVVDALKRAEADDDVTVVLVQGAGRAFCSGYDLAQGMERLPDGWIRSRHFDSWTDQFARSCLRDWLTIWDLLKPVVAKVHGYCLAGGTELMSMCDIVFAADDAVFGYPPSRGMSSPDVAYFPWKMTMARAKYMMLTGNSVSGKEAAQIGLIAKSFPPDELDEQVARELRPLSQIAPDLLAATKGVFNQAYELMGMRTHLQSAWLWHMLSSGVRPGAGDWANAVREGGIRGAIDWRDRPFRKEGFVP